MTRRLGLTAIWLLCVLAALNQGKSFVGIEASQHYYQVAIERLRNRQ